VRRRELPAAGLALRGDSISRVRLTNVEGMAVAPYRVPKPLQLLEERTELS